jgi:UDP-N-acetylmuramate dehydrogenase
VIHQEQQRAVDRAAALLGSGVRRNHPIAPLTTYRVGGCAALFMEARSVDDLVAVARARAATGLPALVIGRGSNLLVADEGYRGIVVSIAGFATGIDLGQVAGPDPYAASDTVLVTAGGGVALPVLARRTASAGLRGFEWAVGVPGSVGGGVRMNAGGHGSDMSANLIDVDLVDLDQDPETGVIRRPVADLGLAFRSSALNDHEIVVSARLELQPGDRAAAEHEIAEIVRWRREHQPGGQNCGSVFVNPVPGEVTAGELIDDAGLRGFRIGTAQVSDKHANFVQADDGGLAGDVYAVIAQVRERVAQRSGFVLRSEVKLVGFT